MGQAATKELVDGSWVAHVPECKGVVAFGETRDTVLEDLRSTLEDWVRFSSEHGQPLPVLAGIDLNPERGVGSGIITVRPVGAVVTIRKPVDNRVKML